MWWSIRRSRWYCSSSLSSSSTLWLLNRERSRSRSFLVHRMTVGSSHRFDDQRNRRRQPLPLRGFGLQRLAASRGELVVLRATIVLARGPFGLDPPLLFEFVKCGVQGTLAHAQLLVRHLSNSLRDSPAMHRLQGQDTEKQQIKCALDQIRRFTHRCSSQLLSGE